MESKSKITYIDIPNEVSLLLPIDIDLCDAECDIKNNDNITCIILNGDADKVQEVLDKFNKIKEIKGDIKIAWFNLRKTLPFKAENFDYLKLNETLYANIGDESKCRFIDITSTIENLNTLDPLDKNYFEKFEELKSKKKYKI